MRKLFLVVIFLLLSKSVDGQVWYPPPACDFWLGVVDGKWNTADNWFEGYSPNGQGINIGFGDTPYSPQSFHSVVDMQGDRRCNDCIICSEYAMTLQNGSLRCYSFECYGNIMISRLVCDNLTIGGT